MDKHSFNPDQQKSCCEKVYAAVRNPSPLIRTVRFTKQQHPANHITSSAKASLMTPTPLRDRCVRVKRVGAVSVEASSNVSPITAKRKDHFPQVPKQPVKPPAAHTKQPVKPPAAHTKQPVKPPAAHTKPQTGKIAGMQGQKGNHPLVPERTTNQAKPTILPIGGHENNIPPHVGGPNSYIAQSINGMSSEYIERVWRNFGNQTNVGSQKPTNGRDSFNEKVTDFIDVTKNKFHNALSFNEGTEKKEKRHK